ncbi:MAG: LuxR C-terminal-related transcriptional regulator [Christensenellales bacterium]
MNKLKASVNRRVLSVIAFGFLFSYLMAFLFEGQVLYSLLDSRQLEAPGYIAGAIAAHFAGLFGCGFIVKTPQAAKHTMLMGMGVCLPATVPFFFPPCALWLIGLIVAGFASGCSVASWGYYLKAFTPKNERIKSCADALIYSNLLMIAINVVVVKTAPQIGLICAMASVLIGMAFIWLLPVPTSHEQTDKPVARLPGSIGKPLGILFLFAAIITVNSGLMYQVINPAFEHLAELTSWYWAVPYIAALVVMRSLPRSISRSVFLYIGMAMIMAAFIGFMLLSRGVADYLIVDTLMLGACGIFDLFWWSILGEMLDYTKNTAKVFGIGLSANVLGVLGDGLVGFSVASIRPSGAEVAVIALVIVCVTLTLLPPLNRHLILLLKSHAYLAVYDRISEKQRAAIIRQTKTIDPLTGRENEVLALLLGGKSNRAISQTLFISESTVKTHVRSIFSKYDVSSRAELISTLLKNQDNS